MDNGSKSGNEVKTTRCAVATITMNMETGIVTIGGSVPTLEFGKMLCQAGADEFERKIAAKHVQAGIAIAGPELLENLKGRG